MATQHPDLMVKRDGPDRWIVRVHGYDEYLSDAEFRARLEYIAKCHGYADPRAEAAIAYWEVVAREPGPTDLRFKRV